MDKPKVGDEVEVFHVPCRVIAVLPNSLKVEATDGSGRAWHISSLRDPQVLSSAR